MSLFGRVRYGQAGMVWNGQVRKGWVWQVRLLMDGLGFVRFGTVRQERTGNAGTGKVWRGTPRRGEVLQERLGMKRRSGVR